MCDNNLQQVLIPQKQFIHLQQALKHKLNTKTESTLQKILASYQKLFYSHD